MSDPILYLMSKYTGRELASLKENQDAWLALDQKGYLVYSPICETHNIEEARKTSCKYMDNNCPYPILSCGTCKDVYKPIDYVARDLRLLASWLKHDWNNCIKWVYDQNHELEIDDCEYFDHSDPYEGFYACQSCELRQIKEYDSGVVGVVLESGKYSIEAWKQFVKVNRYDKMDNLDFLHKLNPDISKGVINEYRFMQSKHIKIITLEIALTKDINEWNNFTI